MIMTRITPTPPQDRRPQPDVLAIHVMRAISRSQRRGRGVCLEELAREVGARKADVRAVVSALHAQGFLDALRLRLTLAGLAIAEALRGQAVVDVRRRSSSASGHDKLRRAA